MSNSREDQLFKQIGDLRSQMQQVEDDKDLVKSEISKKALETRLEYMYVELEELEMELEKLEG